MGTTNISADGSSGRRAVISNQQKDHESFCPNKSLKLVPAHYYVKKILALLQKTMKSIGPTVEDTVVT